MVQGQKKGIWSNVKDEEVFSKTGLRMCSRNVDVVALLIFLPVLCDVTRGSCIMLSVICLSNELMWWKRLGKQKTLQSREEEEEEGNKHLAKLIQT